MSAYVWIDEEKKAAIKSVIEVMGEGVMTKPLQDILDEVKKTEEFKLNKLFVIG